MYCAGREGRNTEVVGDGESPTEFAAWLKRSDAHTRCRISCYRSWWSCDEGALRRSLDALGSGGTLQSQSTPLIGEARGEIHEPGDAVAAGKLSRTCGVDQGGIEEGQR